MLLLTSVWLNLFTILYAQDDEDDISFRILYSRNRANASEHQYFAGLTNCGAAVVSESWLATAAHCVQYDGHQHEHGLVWVGDFYTARKYHVFDKVVVHPNYKMLSDYKIPVNDIALLRLSKQLKFNKNVKPLKLPTKLYALNATHTFSGKGVDETGKNPKYLMQVELRTVALYECISHTDLSEKGWMSHFFKEMADVTICTKRKDEMPSLCFGDSGSPLVRGNTLVGLASFVNDECHVSRMALFTNVWPFVSWIKSVTEIK